MTISTSASSVTAAGNGSTTSFNFSFVAGQASNIVVIYTDADSNATVLAQGSQYALTINAPAAGQIWGVGGAVTYPLSGPPIAAGTYLTIERAVSFTQLTSISNQGDFYPQAVEQAMDTLEMQIQQVEGQASRAITFNPADVTPPTPLPIASVRAGQFITFDSDGQVTVGLPLGSGVPVSQAMQPVLVSVSLAAALALLGGASNEYTGPNTGAVQRTLYSKVSDFVSVKDFGAVGNGVVDDTAAINTALANARGIFMPPGTYVISSDLLISVASATLWAIPGTANIVASASATFTVGLIDVQASACSILGINLNGNMNAGTLANDVYCGIVWQNVSGITIRDCTISNVPFNGVFANATSGQSNPQILIDNLTVTNVGWAGVYLTAANGYTIAQSSVTSCGYHGFALSYVSEATGSTTACNNGTCSNLKVNRGTAPSHVLTGHTESGGLFFIGAGTTALSLTNSQFYGNGNPATNDDGIIAGQDATNSTSGILVDNCLVSQPGGFGIDVTTGMTVSNCEVFEGVGAGIALDLDVGTTLSEATVIGNRIINTVPAAGGGCFGIFFQSLTPGSTFSDIDITGNQVIDNRGTMQTINALFVKFTDTTYGDVIIEGNNFAHFVSAPVGTDVTIPVPSGIYCRDNLGLEYLGVTSGTTLDATFYEGFSLSFAAATTITNIFNGWKSQPVTLQPTNGNASVSNAGSGSGSLAFTGGPTKTIGSGQIALASQGENGNWGVLFS